MIQEVGAPWGASCQQNGTLMQTGHPHPAPAALCEKQPWLLAVPAKGRVLPLVGSLLSLGALPQLEGPGVVCICAGNRK